MKGRILSLPDISAKINFGRIRLSKDEKLFRLGLSRQILQVIKTLPHSAQTNTLLALVNHLKVPLKSDMDFFKGFYPPAWSILHWILISFDAKPSISDTNLRRYQRIHAIAMLLHLIDDHMADGDIPATHLTLLFRSQLWMAMHQALDGLAERRDTEVKSLHQFIDRYYGAIENSAEPDSLDSYCEQFKDQMGMGYIAPVHLTKRLTDSEHLAEGVQTALGAFGCAWRLLDDLHDIKVDMQSGETTAVFLCLPDDVKRLWVTSRHAKSDFRENVDLIIESIRDQNIKDIIIEHICRELDLAASAADAAGITGYAEELTTMAKPLRMIVDAG